MFERYTERARKVMAHSKQKMLSENRKYIGTVHILYGLLKEGVGMGANVLKNLNVDLTRMLEEIEKILNSEPLLVDLESHSEIAQERVREFSIAESRLLKHNYIGTEHILLALLRIHDGLAAKVLKRHGLTLEKARVEIKSLLGAGESIESHDIDRNQQSKAHENYLRRKPPFELALKEFLEQYDAFVFALVRERDNYIENSNYLAAGEKIRHS